MITCVIQLILVYYEKFRREFTNASAKKLIYRQLIAISSLFDILEKLTN